MIKKFFLPALFIILSYSVYPQSIISDKNKITPGQIADNFISEHPKSISYENKEADWNYETGFMLYALWRVYEKTGDEKYFSYVKKIIDNFVDDNGEIKTYDINQFRLDDILTGRTLINLYKKTKDEKYKKAIFLLRKQLKEQPRNKEGGFWHKKIYENQMWLDGLYMAEPFYAKFAEEFNEPKDFDDIAHQFILMHNHALDKNTGLLYHGWDESKTQKWSDPKTGDSPSFWGRAMGWYLMGLVDVLDYFPKDNPLRQKLLSIFQQESKALLNCEDRKTNLWYLILDKPNKKGNYLEASSSAMFMYAFAKGANRGYLDKEYFSIAEKIYSGFTKKLIKKDGNNFLSIINTISGAGLSGKPYRDGSFEYYISELKRTNDFKAIAPFILALLQLEKHKEVVGLDYYFNHELKENKNGEEVQYHYIWEDTANSGYSELGDVIKNLGAKLGELHTAPTAADLKKISIYIIVDPDTPLETAHPNYIDEASIKNIVAWVKAGGVLALFANDKGNCEFDHLNKLAGHFGIQFNEDSRNHVIGNNYNMGKFDNLPSNTFLKGVKKIYLKEISTLKLTQPAKEILTDNGDVIMASCKIGKGFVFAVGDPWFYNEYIDHRKLPGDFDNKQAAHNLFKWLLSKSE